MKKILIGVFIAAFCCAGTARAQDFAMKTNLLYWTTTTPNIGMEIGLGRRTSLDISGGYNPWTLDKEANRKLKHWLAMPEFRYWICERFNGHFFGIHGIYSFYNVSAMDLPFMGADFKDHRYQGWAAGAGLSYGYSWILGKRWNLEATFGLGYIYTNYDKYECVTCGSFKGENDKHYLGPTKAGISLIYIIK